MSQPSRQKRRKRREHKADRDHHEERGMRSAPPRAALATSLGIIVVAWVLLYCRVLFLGKIFVSRDQLIYTWTERKALADALMAARLPQWNDLVAFGRQFTAADGVVYFPLWLVALLPLPHSMDLVTALHVLLAGIGVALFARRLGANVLGTALAGVSFMSCGYVATFAPYGTFTGAAWLPWVAWAVDRVVQPGTQDAMAVSPPTSAGRWRAAMTLAAFLAAQLLAGDPASTITTGLVGLVVALSRADGGRLKSLGWIACGYVAALVLAAAAVFPGLALLPHTSRRALSFDAATVWSLHPWRLLELIWPRFLGNPLDPSRNVAELVANSGGGELEPSLSLSLYLGAPILGLAAIAASARMNGRRALLVGAVVLVVLACGAYTPLYSFFRALFPPERITRYPEKHVLGAICILCALAGAGVTEVGHRKRAARSFVAALAALALPLIALALLRGWIIGRLGIEAGLLSPPLELASAFSYSMRSGATTLAVAACVSWLLLESTRPRLGNFAGGLALAIYFVHALWEGWAITPVGSSDRYARIPMLLRSAAAELERPAPPPRLLRSPVFAADAPYETWPDAWHETLYLDSPGRFGFAGVPGFDAWRSAKFEALWARAGRMPLDSFLTLFAVDFVVLPKDVRLRLFPDDGARPKGSLAELELGYVENDPSGNVVWTIVHNSGVRPRAFVAPRWRWISPDSALDTLLDPARVRDPGLVLLSGTGNMGATESGPLTPCTFAAYSPDRITLRCDSPAGGYAILADEYAPGWTATVDGRSEEVVRADLLFRAVRVPPGLHWIELTFRTPLLIIGLATSAMAWAAWSVCMWWTRGRKQSVS